MSHSSSVAIIAAMLNIDPPSRINSRGAYFHPVPLRDIRDPDREAKALAAAKVKRQRKAEKLMYEAKMGGITGPRYTIGTHTNEFAVDEVEP